jgi:CO/xanthine dehydrogenase Mo-binding subunit
MNLAFKLAATPDDGRARLPGSLQVNRRLSQWLTLRADGVVEVRSGKVEIGQGILTALAQIVACELDVDLARLRMVPAETGLSPDEAVTSGSLSVQESGTALRFAAAEARGLYLAHAAGLRGLDPATLTVRDGAFLAEGRPLGLDYWAFADAGLLDREATAQVAPKPASALEVVGRAVPRSDIPDKVFGRPRFIHDLELPAMLHGAVMRPASPAARLTMLDESAARAVDGVVQVVRDGSFVGVLARTAHAAATAVDKLRAAAQWDEPATLPDMGALAPWLKAQPLDDKITDERSAPEPVAVARTVRAAFTKPWLAHASIAPSCALAQWHGEGGEGTAVEVWTHSQGIYNLRADLALALGLPAHRIVVRHAEGAGCYGHNAADDVAFDAVLLARAAGGAPVRVQWSRADELAWSPHGPAMAIEIEADLDAQGRVVGWRHDVWGNGHGTRPGRARTPALLAAWYLEKPYERLIATNAVLAAGGGAERNAVPGYEFPAWRIVNHRVLSMPMRASALRSLGAFGNVFAIESFIDDLAREAAADPLDWRLGYMRDPRARAVLEAAAARSGWRARAKSESTGYGLAWARYKNTGAYCAVVAEIEAGREIRVRRLWVAVDAGRAVNPDGIANQIEGGAIQATSWTLKEAVAFDRTRVLADSWEAYPILRFLEVPRVEVEILSDPEVPSSGAGEAAHGPVAAAIGNAVMDALGLRIRDLPITPERIVAALG